MTGAVPQPETLEGLIQRQLVLFEAGMRIKDPMDFFEEITRYKMVKGIFPMELLYLPDQSICLWPYCLAGNRQARSCFSPW